MSSTRRFSQALAKGVRVTGTAYEQCVGNTPLLYLKSISERCNCNIYGKAEFLNPSGSVKDRTALAIVKEAESRGELVRGEYGIIVESTTGNTGTALSLIGNMFGYDPIMVIPKGTAKERKKRLINYGAKLIQINDITPLSGNHFHAFAARLSKNMKERLGGVKHIIYGNQLHNLANYRVHYNTTGPEIYKQLDGEIHALSGCMGTGGSIVGIGKYLKEYYSKIKICSTDPRGGYMYNYFNYGEISKSMDPNNKSIAEGAPGTKPVVYDNIKLNNFKPHLALEVDDTEMAEVLNIVKEEEGLAIGLSAGINIAGAMKVAKELNLGKNDNLVTLICDGFDNYASKLENWLENQKIKNNNNSTNSKDNKNSNNNNSVNPIKYDNEVIPDGYTTCEETGFIHPFDQDSAIAQCIRDTYYEGIE